MVVHTSIDGNGLGLELRLGLVRYYENGSRLHADICFCSVFLFCSVRYLRQMANVKRRAPRC